MAFIRFPPVQRCLQHYDAIYDAEQVTSKVYGDSRLGGESLPIPLSAGVKSEKSTLHSVCVPLWSAAFIPPNSRFNIAPPRPDSSVAPLPQNDTCCHTLLHTTTVILSHSKERSAGWRTSLRRTRRSHCSMESHARASRKHRTSNIQHRSEDDGGPCSVMAMACMFPNAVRLSLIAQRFPNPPDAMKRTPPDSRAECTHLKHR